MTEDLLLHDADCASTTMEISVSAEGIIFEVIDDGHWGEFMALSCAISDKDALILADWLVKAVEERGKQ